MGWITRSEDCGKVHNTETGHYCWKTVGARVPDSSREEWTTCARCRRNYNCAHGHTCAVKVDGIDYPILKEQGATHGAIAQASGEQTNPTLTEAEYRAFLRVCGGDEPVDGASTDDSFRYVSSRRM